MSNSTERTDILDSLTKHRYFLSFTARDLTDEQAGQSPTSSELCIAGLIKHVTSVESGWAEFIVEGPSSMAGMSDWTDEAAQQRSDEFRLLPGETVAGILDDYADVARSTDALVTRLPDLDAAHPLPAAPWFEPGTEWSARRVLMHIIAETAQHAGHADIIRESLDGAKSMG